MLRYFFIFSIIWLTEGCRRYSNIPYEIPKGEIGLFFNAISNTESTSFSIDIWIEDSLLYSGGYDPVLINDEPFVMYVGSFKPDDSNKKARVRVNNLNKKLIRDTVLILPLRDREMDTILINYWDDYQKRMIGHFEVMNEKWRFGND